jgi:uncharacterized protein YbjT (DUF2867 family)
MKTALIAGATGLVGQELLQLLLDSSFYTKVIVITRKRLEIANAKLEQIVVTDFREIREQPNMLKAHHVFCCLGTTIKKAKSKEEFEKIDLEYPLLLAQLALRQGANQYSLVSAMGASEKSLFYYSRVKGKLENALAQMSFKSLQIFRPSLLLGERTEKRMGEDIAKVISKRLPFLYAGPMRKYSPIHAREVALGMYHAAIKNEVGVKIFESEQIKQL